MRGIGISNTGLRIATTDHTRRERRRAEEIHRRYPVEQLAVAAGVDDAARSLESRASALGYGASDAASR